ncbi:DNA starvation/stationary phase protection protein Dps [Gulosibacter sp. 10]|uniref:DNA starvation/stationary phase protection protein Dps n=1 Tax=Gulosibacter sp. 10 TaxID=1255570 RepID=UPI00097EF158|nr:DNA starvation/stationary phase protection protein Dps [Gulosibacter sp. 10]SJM53448.1 Non-specific DNA-binding protein Dps / Iron-binding ferritin-like antioxidant protein / Ferroxidase [Gulosibacter sp. 10]
MSVTHKVDFRSGQHTADYTVPGMEVSTARGLAKSLQYRLNDLNELHLTLKHAHWNVQGPNFIAVHEMLDPQIESVRAFADEVAERIVTLGVAASGVPGAIVEQRHHADYDLGFASTTDHLEALVAVYDRVIKGFRETIDEAGEVDKISEDILIGQSAEFEKFQWFMRAHLER